MEWFIYIYLAMVVANGMYLDRRIFAFGGISMKCLECGYDLIEMRRELLNFTVDVESYKYPWDLWKHSHTQYAGHCPNCLCDWAWDELFYDDKVEVKQPTRIFWG